MYTICCKCGCSIHYNSTKIRKNPHCLSCWKKLSEEEKEILEKS
jgi:hypothetical protein